MMSETILTHCAHCAHSRISIPGIWLKLANTARFYYCTRPCWLAGPRSYGAAVQDRDLRGDPLPAHVVSESFLASAARSSIFCAYADNPIRLPSDSPAHVRASRDGEIGVRRLLNAS
jgi:hypothetical protein